VVTGELVGLAIAIALLCIHCEECECQKKKKKASERPSQTISCRFFKGRSICDLRLGGGAGAFAFADFAILPIMWLNKHTTYKASNLHRATFPTLLSFSLYILLAASSYLATKLFSLILKVD
jgi:hypothetical protein